MQKLMGVLILTPNTDFNLTQPAASQVKSQLSILTTELYSMNKLKFFVYQQLWTLACYLRKIDGETGAVFLLVT